MRACAHPEWETHECTYFPGVDGQVSISDANLARLEANRSNLAGGIFNPDDEEWWAKTNDNCRGTTNTADCINTKCSEDKNSIFCDNVPTTNKICTNLVTCDGKVTNSQCAPGANVGSCDPNK